MDKRNYMPVTVSVCNLTDYQEGNTSVERISLSEVESLILQHPAVKEVDIIGKPDFLRGEMIKVFLVLKNGYEPSEQLEQDICSFVREQLFDSAVPREIAFHNELPKNKSGKIMRQVLKAWKSVSVQK